MLLRFRVTSYKGIPREEFALDAASVSESSFYEVDYVDDDGVRWTYGFELGAQRVEAEWLHSYPRGRRQGWLDRDASREQEYVFPGSRIQDRARLARTTRPNALFLSRAATDNHPQLSAIGCKGRKSGPFRAGSGRCRPADEAKTAT